MSLNLLHIVYDWLLTITKNICNIIETKKKMKKITSIILFVLSLTAVKAETINYVMAGSAGGTFNAFNTELIKDLNAIGYSIQEQPGESMVKGGQIYSNETKSPVIVMLPSGQLNAEDVLVKRKETVSPVKKLDLLFGIAYYKVLCVKEGNSLEKVFDSNSELKIGMGDGEKMNNKFVDRLNQLTNSKNIMVPYSSSGKQIQGLVTGDIYVTLVNEAKAIQHTKEKQVSCNYTQNSKGGHGYEPLAKKIKDNWVGWQYEILLLGHIKNVDNATKIKLHKDITNIINDPNSNAGKKIAKNGWFALALDQQDLLKRYKNSFDSTYELFK